MKNHIFNLWCYRSILKKVSKTIFKTTILKMSAFELFLRVFSKTTYNTIGCKYDFSSSALKTSGQTPHKPPVEAIVAKKWEPGNLVPSPFSGQFRKVEARLGKLANRKVETNQESSSKRLGKLEVRPKKKGPHLILVRKLGKFCQIRKFHFEN